MATGWFDGGSVLSVPAAASGIVGPVPVLLVQWEPVGGVVGWWPRGVDVGA